MDFYEEQAYGNGFRFVVGIDEAGRGPLAGPVVAAAVLFKVPPLDIPIRDSKKLSARRRETLAVEIRQRALGVGVGLCTHIEIDEINILRASLKAMKLALEDLVNTLDSSDKPDFLLIDGPYAIESPIEQKPIIKGDNLSISVAAASIIAKTTRDAIMSSYHEEFPEYNFIKNKGYGTKEHIQAIKARGLTRIHRKSFKVRSI